jgi:hypothetical protein
MGADAKSSAARQDRHRGAACETIAFRFLVGQAVRVQSDIDLLYATRVSKTAPGNQRPERADHL